MHYAVSFSYVVATCVLCTCVAYISIRTHNILRMRKRHATGIKMYDVSRVNHLLAEAVRYLVAQSGHQP